MNNALSMKNFNAFLQYCSCPKILMHFIIFPKILMHLQYLCIFQYCTTTLNAILFIIIRIYVFKIISSFWKNHTLRHFPQSLWKKVGPSLESSPKKRALTITTVQLILRILSSSAKISFTTRRLRSSDKINFWTF